MGTLPTARPVIEHTSQFRIDRLSESEFPHQKVTAEAQCVCDETAVKGETERVTLDNHVDLWHQFHDITWPLSPQEMTVAHEVVFLLYSCVAAVILIVMSCFGGAALRSTRTQV